MQKHRKGIAFDLDGTLLDYKTRFHITIRDILKQYGISCPNAEILFRARRQTGSTKKALMRIFEKETDLRMEIIDECLKRREEIIENWKYLEKDRRFRGVKKTLGRLKNQGFVLSVITSRRSKKYVLKSLEKEGLLSFFDVILTRYDSHGKDFKVYLLRKFIDDFSIKECFYVGDSIEDIKDGKRSKVKTIAILSGVDGRIILEKENPDLILKSVSELTEELNISE